MRPVYTVQNYLSTIKLPVITIDKIGYTLTFSLKPLIASFLLALALFILSIIFFNQLALAPINSSFIYLMQSSSTRAKLAVYI